MLVMVWDFWLDKESRQAVVDFLLGTVLVPLWENWRDQQLVMLWELGWVPVWDLWLGMQ